MKHKLTLWFLTIAWAGLTLYLTTVPNFSPSPDTLLSWLMSNGGHFIFFGIQAVLLALNLSAVAALLTSSAYGAGIELIQRNIPGRSMDPIDWLLDTLGAITFLVIMNKMKIKQYLKIEK